MRTFLDGIILTLLVVTAFFGYRYVAAVTTPHADDANAAPRRPILQVEVLNGAGEDGIASRCAELLRSEDVDVVSVANYRSFDIPQTLVLDRKGNEQAAKRVAHSLGVSDDNVLVQLNPGLYVDVSVILGNDFAQLEFIQHQRRKH